MERFGQFIIAKALQRGGMGAIHVAYNAKADRISVLKRNTKPEYLVRFQDEMRLAVRLGDHPNLVKVLDCGNVASEPYIELVYLPGKNIEQVVRRASPIPPLVVIAVAEQICAALEYAHAIEDLKFIHRDISSANVLVEFTGTAHLLDYGLSLSSLKRHRTAIGLSPGTPGYASPEQLTRQAIDARSDIFSLGAVMWCMLMGRPLYSMQSREADLFNVKPRVRTERSDVSPELDALVARAVEIAPQDRFQTAGEMRGALARLRGDSTPERLIADFLAAYYGEAKEEWDAEVDYLTQLAKREIGAVEDRRENGPAASLSRAPIEGGQGSRAPDEKHVPTIVIDRNPNVGGAPSARRGRALLLAAGAVVVIAAVGAISLRTFRGTSKQAEAATQARPNVPPTVAPVDHPPMTGQKVESAASAARDRVDVEPAPPTVAPRAAPDHQAPHELQLSGASLREWNEARRALRENRYHLAEETFQRFSDDAKLRPWGRLGMAEVYYTRKDYERTVRASTEALDAFGKPREDALVLRGEARLRMGLCEPAAVDFRRALRINGANSDARLGLQKIDAARDSGVSCAGQQQGKGD